jgi:hypothetical protein
LLKRAADSTNLKNNKTILSSTMSLDEDIEVIRMKDPSIDFMKQVIQKRFDYAARLAGTEPGSILRIDESGYQAISEVSHNNPGLSLLLVQRVLESTPKPDQYPFIITGEYVRSFGYTHARLCEEWDTRDVTVIQIKPWWEK